VLELEAGGVTLGGGRPLALIAGPCVIESESHALDLAIAIRDVCARHSVPFIYKASFDKANRTSIGSFRGPGLTSGLKTLAMIKDRLGAPVLTDIHDPEQAQPAAEVVDVLQIPAFLCRQTDLLLAAGATGRPVNLKKGQFLAPSDMRYAIEKIASTGNLRIMVTERGTSFGYHNLIVDMRSFPLLRQLGHPVVFDVTHSLQLPGAGEGVTAGQAKFIEPLASAGVAAGIDAIFLEVHDEPERAKSDAQNALPLERLEPLLRRLVALDRVVKSWPRSMEPQSAAVPPR
jgi:2-dehydro-3-deoxyphosphooctonate aldolase (KDO 8-P synthase)